MDVSTNLIDFPEPGNYPVVETFDFPPLPEAHPAEPDVFARHNNIPGHNQDSLQDARIALSGAGGLNGWAALALVKSGARSVIIADHDLVDRTNLPRQLFFGEDLTRPKATCLARNVAPHAVSGVGSVTGINLNFEKAEETFAIPADLLVVGVDNNSCRLHCSRLARGRGIPAVFTMLSLDGMRCQSFLQGPNPSDPCLWCALPNLDPEKAVPCAAAIVSTCLLAASFTVFFAHRALMGWPDGIEPFNWREADLLGRSPEIVGKITRRSDCTVCSVLRA